MIEPVQGSPVDTCGLRPRCGSTRACPWLGTRWQPVATVVATANAINTNSATQPSSRQCGILLAARSPGVLSLTRDLPPSRCTPCRCASTHH
jgi:hypothetical protein